MGKKVVVELDGVTYPSIRAVADAYNLPYKLVKKRYEFGWPWEKIVETPVGVAFENKCKEIRVGNEVYMGRQAFADAYNLKLETVYDRRKAGWSWERIALTPVGGNLPDELIRVEIDGKVFDSVRAIADAYNLPYHVVYPKYKFGYTWDEILLVRDDESKSSRCNNIVYDSVAYESYMALATSLDISYDALICRIKKGKTVSEAVEELFALQKRSNIVYNGKQYTSVTSLAKDLDVSEKVLRNQLACFESVSDAVEATQKRIVKTAAKLISRCKDVACARTKSGGKFILITCKVCGRNVMLPIEEAKKFVHSDNCERNEWLL